jgi:beta-aspartyl-peptidase (threonine type)
MHVPFSRLIATAALIACASCSCARTCREVVVVASSAAGSAAPSASHEAVRKLLDDQVSAWNRHDLDGFLAGYRKDEHVVFITPEGSSRGYADLEQRYRKSYNAPEKFGVLRFADLEFTTVDEKSVVARGTWRLAREKDTPHGRFVLVVCRLEDGWRIVSDYTTVEETGG